MVRRAARRVVGDPVWRTAVLADLRHRRESFPSTALAERIQLVQSGHDVIVSDGCLLRGLMRTRQHDLAALFRYDPRAGDRWFRLDTEDVLTEEP